MKIFLLILLFFSHGEASIEKYFKKIEKTPEDCRPIKNIDYLYLINLDQRPEKFENCMWQLQPYGIKPYRFSAIYGWNLSIEALNEIGVQFLPGMEGYHWAKHFPLHGNGNSEYIFLHEACYGGTFFASWMSIGAIGCTLSHLSVLQDAYDSGYQTIWIMEDDIFVLGNPHLLSDLIEQLDSLVGKEGWDLFYTDFDLPDKPFYAWENDFESDLKGDLWWFWRPDLLDIDRSAVAERTILNDDFIKIGSRMRTHSMIIRRSGMKKILDHNKAHRLFIPYDHDLALVPGIKLYSLRYPIVTFSFAPSDTRVKYF